MSYKELSSPLGGVPASSCSECVAVNPMREHPQGALLGRLFRLERFQKAVPGYFLYREHPSGTPFWNIRKTTEGGRTT